MSKQAVTITSQTFYDLGMWLTAPERHDTDQLHRLLDQDARLPCIDLANRYWLMGALTHSLQHSNVWPQLDASLSGYLLEMQSLYQARAENIKKETIHVCTLLTSAAIDVTVLKGAANLFNGVAAPGSVRFMSDIDLLVREEDFLPANRLLRANGYTLGNPLDDDSDEHWHQALHAPALYRHGGACCIEVHRQVTKYTASAILSTLSVWEQAIALPLSDTLTVRQLNASHQFILSVVHSEIVHNGFANKVIDLRQLVNARSICDTYGNAIDWPLVDQHFISADKQQVLYALLYAAHALLQLSTPLDKRLDSAAKRQLTTCLERYQRFQGPKPNTRLPLLLTLRHSYAAHNIAANYGSGSRGWLLKGRLRHLKRHLLMATKSKYLKHLYRHLLRT